jgi:hypothetical protein
MFILIFPLQNRGIVVFSHYQTNHFMFAYHKFKFFLMVPKGILKKFAVIVPAYYGLVQGKVKKIQVFLSGPIGNLKRVCCDCCSLLWTCTRQSQASQNPAPY